MKKNKKENRRSVAEYPALRPELNLKSRAEAAEIDYLHKLTSDEKAWLNQFHEEYVNASMNKFKKKLHKTAKLKKSCYDANNARNRDLYTKSKVGNTLRYLEDLKRVRLDEDTEDRLIEKIDKEKNKI